jgi:hypothetical protein
MFHYRIKVYFLLSNVISNYVVIDMFFHVFHTHAHTVDDSYKLRVTTDCHTCDQHVLLVKHGLLQTLYRHKAKIGCAVYH